jgi:PHD/YefM family antitoxin component YafN of YafNO toxin-antitoxin module
MIKRKIPNGAVIVLLRLKDLNQLQEELLALEHPQNLSRIEDASIKNVFASDEIDDLLFVSQT